MSVDKFVLAQIGKLHWELVEGGYAVRKIVVARERRSKNTVLIIDVFVDSVRLVLINVTIWYHPFCKSFNIVNNDGAVRPTFG